MSYMKEKAIGRDNLAVAQQKEITRLRDRIKKLETKLEEIRDVADASEGVSFYSMLARQGLDDE